MSYRRDFPDTAAVDMAKLLAQTYSAQVSRTDRWVNRLLNLLVAVAIGAALAWWLWEWASTCAEALTCGVALVRPHRTPSGATLTNEERLHSAVTSADKAGYDRGYCKGFTAGARYGRVLHFGAGLVAGAALVAGALQAGFIAGGAA